MGIPCMWNHWAKILREEFKLIYSLRSKIYTKIQTRPSSISINGCRNNSLDDGLDGSGSMTTSQNL